MQTMTLNQFLVWLFGGGAIIVVSWVLEQVPWYQGLQPQVKQFTFFGFSLVVALGAYAVQTYVPADTLTLLAPWFAIASATFIAIYLGSTFHTATKLTDQAAPKSVDAPKPQPVAPPAPTPPTTPILPK